MENQVKTCAVFLLIIITGALMVPSFTVRSYAQPQVNCFVEINKFATPSDGTVFTFVVTGGDTPGFDLISGESNGFVISPNNSADVVEELPDGWVLDDVECETENTSVTTIENGVRISCPSNGGAAGCSFSNREEVGNIPTLSEWGTIGTVAGLMFVGVFFAVRRRISVTN